jgi:lysophospholipase L1-like esterase
VAVPYPNLFRLGYGCDPNVSWPPLSIVEYAVTPMSAFIAATYNTGTLALTEGAGNNYHLAYPATATMPATRPAVVVEAKPNGRSWLQLRAGGYVSFDVTNGVVGSATNLWCRGIRALADGWYELSMAANFGAAEVWIALENADDSPIYVGDGASGVLLRNYRIADFKDGKVPAHTLQAAPFTYERLPYPKYRGGVALGDSFTFNHTYSYRVNDTSTNVLLLPQGIGGETLAQVVARFTADATPCLPSFVLLMAGINTINAAGADPNASMQASIATFVADCIAIGAIPVLCKIPPDKNYGSWSADRQTWADTYNAWLASYAAARGYLVLDLPAILATGDGQTLDAGFDSGDGLHPNTAGYNAIGDAIVTALDSETVPP